MGDLSEHFDRSEFECSCPCCIDTVDYELVLVLEDIRSHFGKPIHVNSGFRCPENNDFVGGSKNSMHLYGKAADIVVSDVHQDMVATYLENKYFSKYGIGRYEGRTHIDVRPNKARWDNR